MSYERNEVVQTCLAPYMINLLLNVTVQINYIVHNIYSVCAVSDDLGGSKVGVELPVIAWWRVWTGLIWLGYNTVESVCECGNIGFSERR